MSAPTKASNSPDAPDTGRRTLLAALLAGCAASYLPWTLAQPAQPGNGTARDAFLNASKLLTGRNTLDDALATRLYQVMAADDARFPNDVQTLWSFIDSRKIDPMELQHALDAEKSPVAALPKKITAAWYLGIVGEGEGAHCVAYETALNAVIVSDMLKPPTYCYGVYGSWAKKPTLGT